MEEDTCDCITFKLDDFFSGNEISGKLLISCMIGSVTRIILLKGE